MEASVLDSLSTTQSLTAGLSGGYVVTQNGSGLPSGTLNLRTVADLATVVDDYTLSNTFPDESCCNNNGNAYILTSAGSPSLTTTRTLRSITQSGGVLSVTDMGSFTVPSGGGNLNGSWLDPDDTQVLVRYSAIGSFSAVNTGTGALDWTSAHTGHSLTALACMGNDRYMAICSTHSDIELWDGATDTLLDSIARDADRLVTEQVLSLTATTALYAIQVDDPTDYILRFGAFDITGDAIAWDWGPTDYVTVWPRNLSAIGLRLSAWGTLAAIGLSQTNFTSFPALPLYLCDCLTGSLTATNSDSSVSLGIYENEFFWTGADGFAFHDVFDYSTLTSWSVTNPVPPVYRRPIGKSYHLRQRQTPFIT